MSDGYTLSAEELAKRLEQRSAPHVSYEGILSLVKEVTFYKHKLCTICAVDLANGFTVFGTSAAAHPANHDEEIGRHYSFENAMRQVWPLEGYRLKSQLTEETEHDHEH